MKILVADDDPVFTTLMESSLSQEHHTHCVHDGSDVLTAFIDGHRLKAPYDVILLDLDMPHMSGLKILEKIRKYEVKHLMGSYQVFIAIVSGSHDSRTIRETIKLGCNHYFIKPITPSDIVKKLSMVSPKKVSGLPPHSKSVALST
jgi:CheY-like chemotaxis protein